MNVVNHVQTRTYHPPCRVLSTGALQHKWAPPNLINFPKIHKLLNAGTTIIKSAPRTWRDVVGAKRIRMVRGDSAIGH